MAKAKALRLAIYTNPHYRRCSAGGWSEHHDDLYVKCPKGPIEIDEDDPALFDLEAGPFGSIRLVPCNHPDGLIGPMMGGNYAGTTDSRFSEMCRRLLGHHFYGAVAIHDRFETQENYNVLSF